MGLLDSPFNLIKLISARFSGVIVVSSNLKANLAALIVGAQGPSILNGLGRFQYSPVFRFIFLRLVRIRKRRKFFFVQRYRDYSWLRLNVPGIQMEWMLGSGAEPMDVSVVRTPGTYVVISRPEKLKVMEHQMAAAVDCLGINQLIIYGVGSDYRFRYPPTCNVRFMGYVEPIDFFAECGNFLQLDGYGEGFPHTLAYSLCSNANIIIEKRLSISLGMHRLAVKREFVAENYVALQSTPEMVDHLSSAAVYKGILEELKSLVEAEAS